MTKIYAFITCFLVLVSVSSFRKQIIFRKTTSTLSMVDGGRNLMININGNSICYDYMKSTIQNSGPPIVYLPGA